MTKTKQKGQYVDGFVLVVPRGKEKAYKKMAEFGAKIWKKYGALDYKECVIEDPNPSWIKLTFPKLMKLKKGETVWFSYIVYKSRKHRDEVNKKVMKDPAMNNPEFKEMPIDMKRFTCAGFKVVVSF